MGLPPFVDSVWWKILLKLRRTEGVPPSHFGFHLWHFIWPSQDLAVLKDKEEEHAWRFLNCSWLINDGVERFFKWF